MSSTQTFINAMRVYLGDRFCDEDTLQALQAIESSPSAPVIWDEIKIRRAGGQVNLVMNNVFAAHLRDDLDWEAVRTEARTLLEKKRRQLVDRDDAREQARFGPLNELREFNTGQFAERWAAAWSDRSLEGLVSLFHGDGQYSDELFDIDCSGHADLRQRFAALFHQFRITLTVEEVEIAKGSELKWVRTVIGLQDQGRSAFTFRGHSTFEIDRGRIRSCKDALTEEDNGKIVLMKKLGPFIKKRDQ